MSSRNTETKPGTETYRSLRIRPTHDPLDPSTVESHFRRLRRLKRSTEPESKWKQLFSRDQPVTIEWLLVTSGQTDAPLEYHISIDSPDESDIQALTHLCRGLFPNTYEIEQIDRDPLETLTTPSPEHDDSIDEIPDVVGIEFYGVAERREDWQTRLTPFSTFEEETQTRLPLTAIVETLSTSTLPMAYQVLLHPYRDWRADALDRRYRLEHGRETMADRFVDDWFGPTTTEQQPNRSETLHEQAHHRDPAIRQRLTDLEHKDAQRSFILNARAIAIAVATSPDKPNSETATGENKNHNREQPDALGTIRELQTALESVSGLHYQIRGVEKTGDDAQNLLETIKSRSVCEPTYDRIATRLPWTENTSQGIIADPTEAPAFCLIDATALTAEGTRGLSTTPKERTALAQPPTAQLTHYRENGLTIGHPVTQDGTPEETPIALPPSLQSLHVAWFGKTGSGKSTSLINGILDNHDATDGADILIDPKGDGMSESYLLSHYARFGTLDNVYYFDCAQTLPALSFFDIRQQLEDGIDRTSAVEDVVEHYIEILTGIMGRERFERAVRSPDIIRYLLKTQFDPVHGKDVFSHRDLQALTAQFQKAQEPPTVSDKELQLMLDGVAANSKRSFTELLQGVANRIEKIPLDKRLGMIFNNTPTPGTSDPYFDLRSILDKDAVVIIDTGGLRPESQRAMTLLILSTLWSALRRRTQQQTENAELPLVNLYIEEAAHLGGSTLLSELLSQSRSFGLSITLAMQFPAQLRHADPRAYAEVINNVSTVVAGNVSVDTDLAQRFATEAIDTTEVSNRLRALQRGEWMVRLPAKFGNPEPQPFLVTSAALPTGHPDGLTPLTSAQETGFKTALDTVYDRTRLNYGLDLSRADMRTSIEQDTQQTKLTHTDEAKEPQPTEKTETTEDIRLNSALPYTTHLPEPIDYDPEIHALVCETCQNRYDPTAQGMRFALMCCNQLSNISRDDIPICDISLKLSRKERRQSPFTDAQLRLLQVVYTAHQRHYDPKTEYDPLYDSMKLLEEYVGISPEERDELVDTKHLTVDCTYPHKLYTVTSKGRKAIKIGHREGIAYGHTQGDLNESTLHIIMVELGRRYIEETYVNDRDSPVTEALSYYEVKNGDAKSRLDAVGIDKNENIIITLEAERSNHDSRRAVPSDYDKMATHEPEAAIWVVKNRDGAHNVLSALNEPLEGDPRVDKTYSPTSPPSMFMIDEPGFTDMLTLQQLQKMIPQTKYFDNQDPKL